MNNQLEDYVSTRLKKFPILAKTLGEKWINKQLRKEISKWSLIVGWLATPKANPFFKPFSRWLCYLERSLVHLQTHVDKNTWSKLSKKIRAHSDRENTKGTLSEIALCVFLTKYNLSFDMEKRLDAFSKRDVDFAVHEANGTILNIEVHWLGESDDDEKANQASADYGGYPYQLDFAKINRRIRKKILKKAAKFTKTDITLIAFNVTDDPINGSSIFEAFEEGLSSNENPGFHLVDGIIWFEIDPKEYLELKNRGFVINDNSPFANEIRNSAFYKSWAKI